VTLLIRHPPIYEEERQYVYHVVLREFLGLDYYSIVEERRDTLITMGEDENRGLVVSDILFQTPQENWLKPSSLPSQPLEKFNLSQTPINSPNVNQIIPVIYGSKLGNGNYINIQGYKVR